MSRLFSRPAVQTGLVLGGIAAIRAYQPSLVPRSRNDHALIVAASIASGYAAGNAIERGIGVASSSTGLDRAVPAGMLAGAAVAAGTSETPAPVAAAASVARVASGASIILSLSRRFGRGRLLAAALAAGAAGALNKQLRSYPDDARPAMPPSDVGTTMAIGGGVAAAAWGLLATERALARGVAGVGSRAAGPRLLWLAATHAAIAGVAVVGGKYAGRRFMARLDSAGDRVEPGYSEPPTSALVSAGPGSGIGFSDLGVQGRRFVLEATPAAAINRVMGVDSAIDPIRIYIGVDHASSIDARVELAIAELRRTAAFDRSLLIVGSPSGTGYLNYIPIEAAEYFTHGDVASVTIQYGKRPSLLSVDRVEIAQQQHRALVERIGEELARRRGTDRPRLVLYGESLGAQTSEDAFPQPGYEALVERSIDHALWVGTPNATRFQRAVLAANPDGHRFGRAATIADHDPATQYTFLDHHEDPVTLFNPSIWYRPPPWLGPPRERPPNVSRTQAWVPGVTFWQTAFDTKNAATVVPGEFKAFGHDYRADLAEFVRAAYAIDGVSDEQMASVEQALRRSEIERAARLGS